MISTLAENSGSLNRAQPFDLGRARENSVDVVGRARESRIPLAGPADRRTGDNLLEKLHREAGARSVRACQCVTVRHREISGRDFGALAAERPASSVSDGISYDRNPRDKPHLYLQCSQELASGLRTPACIESRTANSYDLHARGGCSTAYRSNET